MLVGVSLGGLVEAKLLQEHWSDLTVVTLASPTFADGISLTNRNTPNLYALYSHNDPVVGERTNWGEYTADFADVGWMNDHDLNPQENRIGFVLADFLEQGDFKGAVSLVGQTVSSQQ